MPTTITVRKNTRKKLEMLKEKEKSSSFDELLSGIANKELGIPDSLRGKYKRLKTTEYRDHIDRTDRY